MDTAPTGGPGVAWRIGGQYLWPSGATVNVLERCLGLGLAQDILQFNQTPASKSVTYLTSRNDSNATKGKVIVRGKTGVRPLLLITNTALCWTCSNSWWGFENLELQQQGASGNCNSMGGNLTHIHNVKVADGGAIGLLSTGSASVISMCEVSGVLTTGISETNASFLVYGNYVHDNSGDGILQSNSGPRGAIVSNIVDTNAGRGIFISGGIGTGADNMVSILNNTIYNCANSGLEVTDIDANIAFFNNIFQNNGDAANEYNVEFVANTAELVSRHGYNCFNTASAGGSANLFNVTADGTEIATDPSFTNAAGGDFSLGSSSPCKATGFPGQFLGANLGYMDMGAVQRQEAGGGAAGIMVGAGMTGGCRG